MNLLLVILLEYRLSGMDHCNRMDRVKILVADEEPILHRLYTNLFREEDSSFLITSVSKKEDLYNSLKETKVDMLILDIHMNGFNYKKDLSELKSRYPDLGIIVCSDKVPYNVLDEVKKECFEFLVRPFKFEKLKESVRDYISFKRTLCSSDLEVDQVDSFLLSVTKDIASKPQGLDVALLNKVLCIMRESLASYSVKEMALELGVSTFTSRRYLEYLLNVGKICAEFSYKRVGRPEKKYSIL